MASMIEEMPGTARSITMDELAGLRGALRGSVCIAGEAGYDDACSLWNGMIERSPAMVVRCAGAADVIRAVRFANEHGLTISVRGGGHNIAGNAACDGGLMIDLSAMKTVRVDPPARRAWVGPGARLGDVDRETQAFGLAVPVGINSTTGIAGLTLGGGFGWLTRPFGMTVDNLAGADIVTADGDLVRASPTENTDLFWAIRGGGGNFGIVTMFDFDLHPLGPEVYSGPLVFDFADAPRLLREYRRIAAEAPDELTVWTVMRKAPPFPFLPAEWHGREVLVFAVCYAGALADGEKAVEPLRRLGKPLADMMMPHAFVAWQSILDPLLTPGARNYWKSHDFTGIPDEAITVLTDAVWNLPGPECELVLAHVGGAMSRVAPNATAYPHRNAHFFMNVHTRWRDTADDNACIAWARNLFEAARPFATGAAYVNFVPDDEQDRTEQIYGANYRRLAEVKRRWDPKNRFRMNHNIRPLQMAGDGQAAPDPELA